MSTIQRTTVGKIVGDNVYVHRSAIEQSPIPTDVVDKRERHLPARFDYDIVKWNRRSGDVSFIQSPDWDTASEPIVGDSCKVDADGTVKTRRHDPENPQIYHHKYQFVASDYDGFNVSEAREHAQLWESLKPDKSRIGYKKYWDAEVVPRLRKIESQRYEVRGRKYTDQEVEIANRTARARGAVGGKAIVPRYVEQTSRKGERILDFGAGPEAAHTKHLRSQGFRRVHAYDFGTNVRASVHTVDALSREYDTVFASNVLNVQSSQAMLRNTVQELAQVVAPEGRLVANLPSEPRKMAIDPSSLTRLLTKHFHEVDRVGGTPSAPLLEARYPRKKYTVAAAHNAPKTSRVA
jgi:SAM-dependent methyltransferase